MSLRTFMESWNWILRNIIYPDTLLKELMQIPKNTSILNFVDNYFIRSGSSNITLTDLNVRVFYSFNNTDNTDVPNVKRSQISFDIYVKQSLLHNVGKDRLLYRTLLIASRLILLLTQLRYLHSHRFWVAGDWTLATTVVGYVRYNLTLNYIKVY